MEYNDFIIEAEKILLDYIKQCVKAGGLDKKWIEDHNFEELISNKGYLKGLDRVEVSSNVNSDTRFSVYYNPIDSMLEVTDTSC